MKNQILKVLIFMVAVALLFLLAPIGFVYALFKGQIPNYLFKLAISIDQTGNVICKHLFNDILIKKTGYQFGHEDETISSVLGKNQLTNTLSWLGMALNWILNHLDPDHSIKSIEENP